MATQFQITPPGSFSFKSEHWEQWIRRFERFRSASGLADKSEAVQVDMLIYCLGEQAEEIYNSFTFVGTPTVTATGETSTEQSSGSTGPTFEDVKAKFESHFIARRNVIYERAKFNQRCQSEGESVDEFITSLYKLSEHCNHGTLKDELIRDRLVVGLRDTKLQQKLQLDSVLTLEKAKSTARLHEQVKREQEMLSSDPQGQINATRSNPIQGRDSVFKPNRTCGRCGKSASHRVCPAKDTTCNNCHKRGHWARCCRTKLSKPGEKKKPGSGKTVKYVEVGTPDEELEEAPSEINYTFIGQVNSGNERPKWTISVTVNDVKVDFAIDTGADETIIPETMYQKLKSSLGTTLSNSDKVLNSANKSRLNCVGKFNAQIKANDRMSKQSIYVVRHCSTPLLGKPAIEALDVVKVVNSVEIEKHHPRLFSGLGIMKEEYNIKLAKDYEPYAVNVPRKIASVPLFKLIKRKLQKLERDDVIFKVSEPTEFCSPMVPVPKRDTKGNIVDVRICVDYTKLNKFVETEKFMLPSTSEVLSRLPGAKFFSKLDANSWFHQIPLSKSSQLLTTFITPFGRFAYKRLPFGITSAPEHAQKRLAQILDDLEGVEVFIDDILVHAPDQKLHDARLAEVLSRLEQAGMTLNKDKCEINKRSVNFVGHIVSDKGILPDAERTKALRDMPRPENIHDVRRFLGVVNQFSKFSPKLSGLSQPIRELLKKDTQFVWGEVQEKAFNDVKYECLYGPCLALFDPNLETKVASDASKDGLGACLYQKQSDGEWKLVFCASRATTETERNYAPIEREALGATWACDTFANFLIGLKFTIETDHKPLISLLGKKDLNELPPRIQRFRIRLMRYSYKIVHIPGKDLVVPDALSRAPCGNLPSTRELEEEVTSYAQFITSELPLTNSYLSKIKEEQIADSVCMQLIEFCNTEWPDKSKLPGVLKAYYPFRGEIAYNNQLLMRGSRIIVPSCLRLEVLDFIHEGHQGIVKCRERAKQAVWWPGLATQIADLVYKCSVCSHESRESREPLISGEFPSRPWQVVGTDLYFLKGSTYLLVVDYYSRYIEVAKLNSSTRSSDVITHLKSIFSRHGIPDTVRSDNGPQYASSEFQSFANMYGFTHITSSPLYSQSNGEAERAVKTVKQLIKKSRDPYLALMAYRTTPLANGYSPAQLLFGRNIKTTLPVTPSQLMPKLPDKDKLQAFEEKSRQSSKVTYDIRHRVKLLDELSPGTHVFVRDMETHGVVDKKLSEPRSYRVLSPTGAVRRNRKYLIPCDDGGTTGVPPDPVTDTPSIVETNSPKLIGESGKLRVEGSPIPPQPEKLKKVETHQMTPKVKEYRTRSGRLVIPPKRWTLD